MGFVRDEMAACVMLKGTGNRLRADAYRVF
jgi:hypothetical protein